MNFLVLILASVAVASSAYAALPGHEFKSFSFYEKFAAAYVCLLIGWPQIWTFLVGPLLWPEAEQAGQVYPTLWYLPAMALSLGYFVNALAISDARFDLSALLQYSLVALSTAYIALADITPASVAKLMVPALCLLLTVVKPARISMEVVCWGCRVSLFSITLAVLMAITVNPARVLEQCRADKCGLAGQVMTSPFAGNGNILGLAVALLIPFAVAKMSPLRTGALLVSVIATAELAGSRSAEIGIAFASLVVIATRLKPSVRTKILLVGTALALAASLVPAIFPFGENQFTFRGFLWNRARELILRDFWFGSGPTAWAAAARSSVHPLNYSPHNMWLDITVSMGVAGLLILAVAIVSKIVNATSDERDVLLLYFGTVLATSTLESVYVPYILGILPFAAALPFVFGGSKTDESHSRNHVEVQETALPVAPNIPVLKSTSTMEAGYGTG